MDQKAVPKQCEPIAYRAVRDQVIGGQLGPIKVEANRLITDPFVIALLKRVGVELLPDYDC